MAEDTPTSTHDTLHTHPKVTRTGYTTQGLHTYTQETRSYGGLSSKGMDYPGLQLSDSLDALDDPASGDGPPQVVAFQLKRLRSDDGSSTTAEEVWESLEQDSSGYVSCSEGFPAGGGASDAEPEFPAGSRSLRSIREDLAPAVSRETRSECHDALPLERETHEVREVVASDGSLSEKASITEGKLATTSFTTKSAGGVKGEGNLPDREGEARRELGAAGRTESASSDSRRETAPSSRPPLTRARPLFGDDEPETPPASAPLAEDVAVRPKSASPSEKKSGEKEDSLSFKGRRNRKKGYASSSSLSLENPLPEIAEDPPAPQHVVVDLTGGGEHVSFVAVSVEEPEDPDSWDHEEALSMKIQTDLESQGDKMASRYLRSKGIRVPPPRHRSFGETVVNISAGEVDCEYVSEIESRKLNKSFNQSDAGEGGGRGRAEYLGHDNLAFVEDEQDAISQEENFATPEESDVGPVELPRRSSDPEVSSSAKSDEVKAEEELFRSASCGTELDKVLNNLSGEQSPVSGTPTLRKRSISRGRQESIHSEPDDTKAKETPDSAKYGDKKVRLRPTFFLGGEENSPSLFSKLVRNSPPVRLKRSESTKSHMSPMAYKEEGLSRSTSNIWEGGTKTRGGSGSSGGGGHHSRLPSTPTSPSVSVKGERRSEKGYLLQQHLYRNSRRNVQQKLHRQLSDSHHHDESSRYSDHHKHDHHHHHHKKHDSHSLSDLSHQSLPTRLFSPRDSSPSRHSQHSHHGHHHRSQSQRHHHKPRHELLRRHNTYGHEQYHKYVQEHEQRYALEHPYEQEQTPDQDTLQVQEDTPERRLSHYRQEEKGKTDVERWVGVHGGQPSEGAQSASPLLTSPTTPHIVVSPEENANSQNANDKPAQEDAAQQQSSPQANNGTGVPNGQSALASPPAPAVEEKERTRPDKLTLTMNTLDLPDSRHPSLDIGVRRNTRRNSMSEMLKRYGSQTNLQRTPSTNNIRRSTSRNSLVLEWTQEGNDSLIACLSALYGKLLVVMGMAFPIAEVISHDIPVTFYNGFYLYLYIGSIIFLVYAYIFLLRSINLPTEQIKSKFHSLRNYMAMPDLHMVFPHRNSSQQEGTGRMASRESHLSGGSELDKESDRASVNTMSFKPAKYTLTESNNHGSMYLKMGAVLFGIGSMIYSGLEVGQYFELKGDDNCADILLAIAPGARMLFTFIQMYFIFLNSRVAISRHRIVARFGLMHMIGTNLCIWLNVLVQETKHEIINLKLGHGQHHGGGNLWALILNEGRGSSATHHGASGAGHHDDAGAILGHHDDDHSDTMVNHTLFNETTHAPHDLHDLHKVANDSHNIVKRSSGEHHAFSIFECRRSDLMGQLVDNASPFLFPCTIEYSLLCAGVLYVIWKNINKPEVTYDGDSDISTYVARKARHHYSVDCAHANRGLFMGILVLVLTIISLILFFVLINNEAYKDVAIMEANIIELSVYGVASVTVVIGMIQMRELEFIPEGDIELDNILLLIAQTGVYIYTSFTVIGGHFTMTDNLILPLLSSIVTLIQTTLQTIFILDASRRCCYNHDQLERKPGREMVTFLLVCNLAMWAINTFETSRADAHPTQLNFYGIWAWTIISHVSMPLAIFYRFHVTVCLCEIWKRSYKLKNDY